VVATIVGAGDAWHQSTAEAADMNNNSNAPRNSTAVRKNILKHFGDDTQCGGRYPGLQIPRTTGTSWWGVSGRLRSRLRQVDRRTRFRLPTSSYSTAAKLADMGVDFPPLPRAEQRSLGK